MRRPLVPLLAIVTCAALPAIARGADKQAPAAPSASASAAPAPPPGPETADSLYNQGNEAYDRADYPLALELYTGAFKLRQSYDVARNLGLTELKLGKVRDAVTHLTYSLDHYPSNRADTKRQVIDWLAQAKSQAGKLRLTIEPESAACTVNGAPIAREELEGDVLVDPGQVKLECGGATGFGTSKRTLQVEKGATETLKISLPRAGTIDEPPPPPPPSGLAALPLPTRRTILFAGIGLTGLALAGGVVSGVLSITKAGEADALLADLRKSSGRDNPCVSPAAAKCADLRDARRTQDLTGNVAVWALIGAAGLGALTGAYLFPASRETSRDAKPGGERESAPTSRPTASIAIAPGVAGFSITGSW